MFSSWGHAGTYDIGAEDPWHLCLCGRSFRQKYVMSAITGPWPGHILGSSVFQNEMWTVCMPFLLEDGANACVQLGTTT